MKKRFFSIFFAIAFMFASLNLSAGYESINCNYYSEDYGMWIAASECDNPGNNCSVKRCDCSSNGAWDPPSM